jgi:pyrroloquinoline quinone (PQQ) biosynthesis protein C
MALTTKSVLARIDQIHEEKPMYGHPLWTGMVEGTFNLDQVRYLCQQHGGIPLHNHKYHGPLYVICPDPDWREMLAEVVYEECTGRLFADGVSHHKLYLNYAKSLGLEPSEMYDPPYCAGVVAFQGFFEHLCGSTFLKGVSAHMLAGEAAIPGLYGRIAKGLQEKFGLDDVGVKYWIVHDTADKEHSDVGRRLLDQFATTEEDRKLVLKTVQEMIDIMHLMYDDIYRHTVKLGDQAAA